MGKPSPAPITNGYPYSAAPPLQYRQSYPHNLGPPPNRRRILLGYYIFVLAMIFGFTMFICWLFLLPGGTPEFYVTSLNVSNFSANQSRVTGIWDAAVEAYNPNKKMSVSYKDIVLGISHDDPLFLRGVYYEDGFLIRKEILPFRQDARDRTPFSARFSTFESYVDGKVVESMNDERARGAVKFGFKLEAIAAFKYGFFGKRRQIRAWCPELAVNVSSKGSGSLVNGARKCWVDM